MRSLFWLLEANCISNLSPNHTLQLTTLRTSVRESQLHFDFCGDSLTDVHQGQVENAEVQNQSTKPKYKTEVRKPLWFSYAISKIYYT